MKLDISEEPSEDLDEYIESLDAYDSYEEFLNEANNKEEGSVNSTKANNLRDVANKDLIKKQQENMKEQQKFDLMGDELEKVAKEIYPKKKGYRSILLEIFSVDICIELERLVRCYDINNNHKFLEIKRILRKHNIEFDSLGGGTNRCGLLISGYAVKIAYDRDGMIDNKREFIYSIPLQPYVIKTYECSPTGLFSVCEYVISLTESEFATRSTQSEMREILRDIAGNFFIGDVGITSKNYANWGRRIDTGELVILDFAYVYSVSYNMFLCTKDQCMLYYNNDFTELICPICGDGFEFGKIRKRITRKDQAKEIGDIMEKGYVLTSPYQQKEFNYKFVEGAADNIKKIIRKRLKKERKRLENEDITKVKINFDKDAGKTTLREVMRKYTGD